MEPAAGYLTEHNVLAHVERLLLTENAAREYYKHGKWPSLLNLIPGVAAMPHSTKNRRVHAVHKAFCAGGSKDAFLRSLHAQFADELGPFPDAPGGAAHGGAATAAAVHPPPLLHTLQHASHTGAHPPPLHAHATPPPAMPPAPPWHSHAAAAAAAEPPAAAAPVHEHPPTPTRKIKLPPRVAAAFLQAHPERAAHFRTATAAAAAAASGAIDGAAAAAAAGPSHAAGLSRRRPAPAAATPAKRARRAAAAHVDEEAEASESEAEDADGAARLEARAARTQPPDKDHTLLAFAQHVDLDQPPPAIPTWTQHEEDVRANSSVQAALAFQRKLRQSLPLHACCVCAQRYSDDQPLLNLQFEHARALLYAALSPRLPRNQYVPRDGNTLWDPAVAQATARAAEETAASTGADYEAVLNAMLRDQYRAARQKVVTDAAAFTAARAAAGAPADAGAAVAPAVATTAAPAPAAATTTASSPSQPPHDGPLQLLWHPDAHCITPRANGNHELRVCGDCHSALHTPPQDLQKNVPRAALARIDNGIRPLLPELTALEIRVLSPLRVLRHIIYCRPLTARVTSSNVHMALHAHIVAHYGPGPLGLAASFPCAVETLPQTMVVVLIGAAQTDEQAVALAQRAPALRIRGPIVVEWAHHLQAIYRQRGVYPQLAEAAVLDAWMRIDDGCARKSAYVDEQGRDWPRADVQEKDEWCPPSVQGICVHG